MANFFNGAKDAVSNKFNSLGGSKALLNTGIDRERNNFLKGLKTTTSGQKEDPTYLGFRLIFDFNLGGLIDPETFLPISPLLTDANYIKFAAGTTSMDLFGASKYKIAEVLGRKSQPSFTSEIPYYSATKYLIERRSSREEGDNGGGDSVAVESKASQSLVGFINLLKSINKKSPWFFQSMEGLDKLLNISTRRGRYAIDSTEGGKASRDGTLTFTCMDSIDLRVTAMADFYRKATYDSVNMRTRLPENLRKFRMYIIVTELRNIVLDRNILDVLNPFGNSAVSNIASNVRDIAQSAGINSIGGKSGISDTASTEKAGNDADIRSAYESLENMEPYIFMYQLDQCEFDFDTYTHLGSSISNAENRNAVTNKFGIKVGKITEKKLQYNILSDLTQNKSAFSKVLIADSYDLLESIPPSSVDINNDGDLFNRLANRFINNSVNSVIQQYSPLVSKAVLGNAYGFQISDIASLANSAQDAVAGIKNLKSPFDDYRPQSRGLGGPKERVYPSINQDVYQNVNPSYFPDKTNVYPGGTGYGVLQPKDLYTGVPGEDLGLPKRTYPSIRSDQYNDVPGADLGVPGRVYPQPSGDIYPTVEGSDLGLPDRVYPSLTGDEYTGTPGPDLGPIGRVYPTVSADIYPTVAGPDLGVPDRVYPTLTGDEYTGTPGPDLGPNARVYPQPSGDIYPTVEGTDLGVPDRVYPSITGDEYTGVPGEDSGPIGRVYSQPTGDLYPDVEGKDLGVPDRVYPRIVARVYPTGTEGNKMTRSDVYPDVPGRDLGGPARDYPEVEPNNQYK